MKKFLITLGVITITLIVGYWGLNWWTESKLDKPAYKWIQETSVYENVKNWFNNDSDVEDDSTEEEIPVETEDGTEATALISL